MRKFYTVLYLAIVLSFMAACGKNDTQAQTPSRQAESTTIESSSQSANLSSSENADESSVAMDSTETADETMSESTIVDETEGMAEPVEAVSEAESVQETERNETSAAETDIQNNTEENKVANMNVQVGDVIFSATLEENEAGEPCRDSDE